MSTQPIDQPVVLRGPQRPDLLRDECLADILSATAARVPKRAALIWGERIVSYEELDRSARKIGAALNARLHPLSHSNSSPSTQPSPLGRRILEGIRPLDPRTASSPAFGTLSPLGGETGVWTF